jgi:hypothetical protein
MKKIVSSILLLSLFLNIVGYHFIFQIQQHNIKEDMEEYLSKSENILNANELRLPLDEISKLKWQDEKEFAYNGELYDVIQQKKVNGELIIQCIKDKKETHLVNDYTKISKETQSDPSSKNKSTVLLKLITGIFIKTEQPVVSLPFYINKKYPTTLCDAISSGTKEILIPPPQLI